MFGNCRRCGGSLFLEVDLGGFVVANCINCGNEEYVAGAGHNDKNGVQNSVSGSGFHNYTFVNGCDRWSDCFTCPFHDCVLPEGKTREFLRGRLVKSRAWEA